MKTKTNGFTDQLILASLTKTSGVGMAQVNKLLAKIDEPCSLVDAKLSDLVDLGLKPAVAAKSTENLKQQVLEKLQAQLDTCQAKVITFIDDAYPLLLKSIQSPPVALYVRGSLESLSHKTIAIVGTRKPSSYARQVVEEWVKQLVANRVTIISGLAYGVDSLAHQACLEACGATLGVLGSGIDSIQPVSSRHLGLKMIKSGGAVVSEYAPGTSAQKQFFPARNRIVAGLSCLTLVVEGSEKSGSLITATFAKESGRLVAGVPGSVNNQMSLAPHKVIQQGAHLVTGVSDILKLLELDSTYKQVRQRAVVFDDTNQEKLYQQLSQEDVLVDELLRSGVVEPLLVVPTLTMMEIKGLVQIRAGKVRRV